ncbi:uncharacterized protein PODANS_2_6720 [Podospora anserina S mat+]|uniref:Podospora anserina S mat+ genomic DNA chromosome 2, supercontig 2 n=1 Tax=Podospora anserina (strain S / ATCC MYA-4624 / DSM 980 / FGSC 10383) TaxID=515849 RepID=B2B650_PODAN|nr:uncharacterized protein PODANS_2_6720 [Podospora anserina S mat+]CAP73275.1 unnamed protein product [Podospora anserina S mat+]CDP25676.1 Putative protein of unknown function [Podospora anserina S mat+]
MTATTPLKVIIIGGGPIGLTLAQILTSAGVDFTILERRSTVTPEEGAGIAIGPTSFRLYDQLGLLPQMEAISTPIPHKHVLQRDGKVYNSYEFHLRACHGRAMAFLHRLDLVTTLFSTLPDSAKAKIHVNKSLSDITLTPEGVTVTCADGTSYNGTLVIGADGVHSKTRKIMNSLSNAPESETLPFETTFQGLFGNFPRLSLPGSEIEPGHDWECHSGGVSSQFFVGRDRGWFIIYRPLPGGPTRERIDYTDEDIKQFAEDVKDMHVTNKLTFGDVFKNVNKAGLTQLQEGAVKNRSWKRIGLVGDACDKITPNVGLGYNNGVLDVIVLGNLLKKLNESGEEITEEKVGKLFKEYQAERKEFSEKVDDAARGVIRTVTHTGFMKYLLDRWINPVLGLDKLYGSKVMGPLMAKQQVLEWLEEKNGIDGSIPWAHKGLVVTKA